MPNYICMTCGMQYAESAEPPAHCLICQDERQYIGKNGQHWTTLEALQADYQNTFTPIEDGLTGIRTTPEFCIAQRAHVIQTPHGNVLWENITLIDEATVQTIKAMGGLTAIAISHPHFYDTMVEWSHAFGNIPIYLHRDNEPWVMRPDSVIHYWDGEQFAINDSLTIIRCGGHFSGSSVLHWDNGDGVLLTGDSIMVVPDRRFVSFMYSYPNLIPMSATKVRGIVEAVEPFKFERLYSSWPDKVVTHDAKSAVSRSAERYIQNITG